MMKRLLIFISAIFAVYCEVDVRNYLTKFGYLAPHAYSDQSLSDAIKQYQTTFGLKVTGVANDETLKLMSSPRCGVADHGKAYGWDTRWRKTDLTYSFSNFSPDLPEDSFRRLTRKALETWAEVALLNFTEVETNGDINVAYGSYSHDDDKCRCFCNFPFDGPSGVLAHAFFPENGRIHFDDSETFTEKSQYGTNYLWVATHELGHTLGLQHDTSSRDAVMFPYYREYNSRGMFLHVNDVYRIRALYGKRGDKEGVYTQPPFEPVTYKPYPDQPTTEEYYVTEEPVTECECCDKGKHCPENKDKCRDYSRDWTNYMKKNCKETCNYCGGGSEPTEPECHNKSNKCAAEKEKCFDYGESWTKWMKKYCQRTCGYC